MSRRKRTLKQAFLVTVTAAAAASVAGGCGNQVTYPEDDSDVITNPPPPCLAEECSGECPTTEPTDGTACFAEGLSCYYGDTCEESQATCDGGVWEVVPFSGSCNPPSPECPAAEPEIGQICEYQPESWGGYPDYCGYAVQTPCGESTKIMGCTNDELSGEMVWAVQEPPASCEVSPADCHLYTEEAGCGADAACQWLVPGCVDDAPEIPAGCYPIGDCAVSGCGDWGSCFTGWYDPCHNSSCGSCGAEINVCVPSTP